jgi:hypothetical protein
MSVRRSLKRRVAKGSSLLRLCPTTGKGFVAGIADGLGHPVFDFDHLAILDFPMEVGEGGNDHVGAVGAAAELLPTAGLKAGFAEHVAEHAFSSGSFLTAIH